MRTTTAFNARLSTLILATGFISATVGCTTRSQVFEGYGDDQLWTAMVASAQKPTYDDWQVMDNEVYVDEATRRIEVYRVLKRTLVTPYSTPRQEEREWKFQIALGRDPELDSPTVDFTARQLVVPAYVWTEADKFFLQMRTSLGAPTATTPVEGSTPAPQAAPAAEAVPAPVPEVVPEAVPEAAPAPEPLPVH